MGFKEIYKKAPQKLKELLDECKKVHQNPKWHSEGNVYIHTQIVTDRLHNTYNDVNLTLSGIFHDLGKITKTFWDVDDKAWKANGHEDDSRDLIPNFKSWIEKMGGDIDIITYVVQNHMRYKYKDEMNFRKRLDLHNEANFQYLEKFGTADYGGTAEVCKPLPDNTEFEKQIEVYNKEMEEKKIINSKFNGRLIMDKYPLKGKELGDAISGFKKSISGDFNEYALSTSSEEIMSDFDNFLK